MIRKVTFSLLLLMLLGAGCRAPAANAPPAGDLAPDFTLDGLDGDRVQLSELLKDGPVLLNFWATWCGPCVRELPELDALAREFSGRGLNVVGVSIDANPAAVRQHLERAPLSFPVLLDTSGAVAQRYGVSGIPHNVVIGTDMTIRYSKAGYAPGLRELRYAVRAVLAE